MKNINIVIVEEDPISRIKMEIFITDFISDKYSFKIVNEFEDLESLLAYLEDHEVDVILSDIFFDKKPLGIEILKKMKYSNISIIIMTDSHDIQLYEECKKIMKFTYLIKPFHQFTLQSAIENAIQANDYEVIVNYHAKKHIIIRNGSSKQDRITFYEIVFLETDGNYSLIHTDSKKFALKKSLNKLLTEDFDEDFIRIHQQYAVNLQHVQVLREHTLQLAGKIDLPVGRTFNTIIRNKFK